MFLIAFDHHLFPLSSVVFYPCEEVSVSRYVLYKLDGLCRCGRNVGKMCLLDKLNYNFSDMFKKTLFFQRNYLSHLYTYNYMFHNSLIKN